MPSKSVKVKETVQRSKAIELVKHKPYVSMRDLEDAVVSNVALREVDVDTNKTVKSKVLVYRHLYQRNGYFPPEYELSEIGKIADTESMVRQAFNKKTALMFKEGWHLHGPNAATIRYIKSRLRQLEISAGTSFDTLLRQTGESLIATSNAYWVKVRDPKRSGGKVREDDNGNQINPVAAYFLVPPETMYFGLDDRGRVNGYRQYMPDGRFQDFDAKNVVHFYIDRKPGFLVGTPSLIPVIEDIRALRRIEENVEMLVYQHLFPIYHVKVGTEEQPAVINQHGEDEVALAKEQLQYMPYDGMMVTSERYDVEALGAESQAIRAEGYLDYFRSRVIAGLGVSSIDFGMGDTANRNTADSMSRALTDSVKDYQLTLESFINRYVIDELLLESGMGHDIIDFDNRVEFCFNEIDIEMKIKKENHAQLMFAANGITHDEFRASLGLEPLSQSEEEKSKLAWWMIDKEKALIAAHDVNFVEQPVTVKTASGGTSQTTTGPTQNASRNIQQPANQHGKALGPTKRKSSVYDNLAKEYFDYLKHDTVFYARKEGKFNHDWIRLMAENGSKELMNRYLAQLAGDFKRGLQSFGNIDELAYDGIIKESFNKLSEATQRTISRLFNDTLKKLAKINPSSIGEIQDTFDSLEFRTTLIANAESKVYYNTAAGIAAKVLGDKEVQMVSQHDCTKCKKTISLDKMSATDFILPHPNCDAVIKRVEK